MNLLPHVYYSAAALAAVAVLLAVCIKQRTYAYAATATLMAPSVLVYLIAMYRIGGVDFENYVAYLGTQRDLIPDIGYRLLMDLTAAVGLNISEFFLLQGLFSLGTLFLLAKKLRSDLVIVAALYLLHGALVRDFSQSRIALALAVYFFALAQERKWIYAALTLLACSIHLSLVPLVFVYHWTKIVLCLRKGRMFFTVAPAVVLIAGISLLLKVLVLVDPRIEVYLNWTEDMYGNPVESYASVALLLVIGAICYRAQHLTGDKESLIFVVMIMYAVAIFIAFRDVSVFASRLSNVVAALYPFAVGRAVTLLKEARPEEPYGSSQPNRVSQVAFSLALVGALLVAIIARSGNLEVLRATRPALLTY